MTGVGGPVSVITGASSGIGAATAELLAGKGHEVWLLARREERLAELTRTLEAMGHTAYYRVLDVSDRNRVEETFREIEDSSGGIDCLVNNAGYSRFQSIQETTTAEIVRMMEVNFFGSVYCTQAVLPGMLDRRKGSIVAVSSVVGKIGYPNYASYAASKFAMAGFFESLHHDLKESGIHVGIVYPSGTRTEFFDHPSYSSRANVPFYTLQPPRKVAEAIFKIMHKRVFEVSRPWIYGFMTRILNATKPLSNPVIGVLNPRRRS